MNDLRWLSPAVALCSVVGCTAIVSPGDYEFVESADDPVTGKKDAMPDDARASSEAGPAAATGGSGGRSSGDEGGRAAEPADARVEGGVAGTDAGDAPAPDTGIGDRPVENCANDIDDDGDDRLDCQDSDCAHYECIPHAPDGWLGPVALYDGPASAAPVECPQPFGVQAYLGASDLSWEPLTCGCSCEAPTGSTCSSGTIQAFTTEDCRGTPTGSAGLVERACQRLSAASGTEYYFRIIGRTPSGGSCEPTSSVVAAPTPAFANRALACQPSIVHQGGCSSDSSRCLPRASEPFGSRPCVLHAGDVPCPVDAYSVRSVRYAVTPSDTRSCDGTCSCGAPSGQTCIGTVTTYGALSMGLCPAEASLATLRVTGSPSDCFTPAPAGGPTAYDTRYTFDRVADGACASTAGASTGEVASTEPTTVCCLP